MGMTEPVHAAGNTSDPAPGVAASPVVNVVGFSGSVSEGAAAIKSPVFEIDGRYFSGDPDAPPATTHTWEELEEYEKRGLVSLASEKRRRERGHVFLYAHSTFLCPSPDAYDLTPASSSLLWDGRWMARWTYMDHAAAVRLLGDWGDLLLLDAKDRFAEGRFRRAKQSAMRARFAATREHREARREAHLYVAAARLGLGEDIDGVLRNVAIDFSNEDAREVENQAYALLRRVRHRARSGVPGAAARFPVQFAAAA